MNHLEKLEKAIAAQHPLPDSGTRDTNKYLLEVLKDMQRKIEMMEQKVQLIMDTR